MVHRVALVQEAQPGLRPPVAARVQDNILAGLERDVLAFLCLHMPSKVTPDRLTLFAACGEAGVCPSRRRLFTELSLSTRTVESQFGRCVMLRTQMT
jgi:hypothetical protein